MPYDEQFRAVKDGGFLKTTLSSALSAIPGIADAAFHQNDINNFSSFNVVHALFEDNDPQNSSTARFWYKPQMKQGGICCYIVWYHPFFVVSKVGVTGQCQAKGGKDIHTILAYSFTFTLSVQGCILHHKCAVIQTCDSILSLCM